MTSSFLSANDLIRFESFNKIIVGFSGGLDSTVLLHVLASQPSLNAKLMAFHVHHGISSNATAWQIHCEQFCYELRVNFITKEVHFNRSANIEEEARKARYSLFSSVLNENDCLVLGHHQDDQAETVLLQLFRGAGVDGLAAMSEISSLGMGHCIRPFLNYSRTQLEHYARLHQLVWIEDESNQDIYYSRNYLRQHIIPKLVQKWPKVVSNLARTALHCQQAKDNLEQLAILDCPQINLSESTLSIKSLKHLSNERVTNILRSWLKKNQAHLPSTVTLERLIHEIIGARTDATPEVSWGNVLVRRFQNFLYIDEKNTLFSPSETEWLTFPKPLVLNETGITLKVCQVSQGLLIPKNAKLIVRFRKGGETIFLHKQTKSLKKLFQQWNIPPWQRERIPLIYVNDQLAAIVGYAVSDVFFKENLPNLWEVTR